MPVVTVEALLAAAADGDGARLLELSRAEPGLARRNLHVAAVLGQAADVRRLVAEDPSRVRTRAGDPPGEPLLWLCNSPLHGQSQDRDDGLEASARALLEGGADPNTRDGRYGLPALFAVTGLRNAPRVAQVLLEAGAATDDGESAFHAAERFHVEALELLLDHGADLNATGDWGNTPLYFLLRHWDVGRMPTVERGVRWLLEHGADPDVRCGSERESSLHVAVRRGQSRAIVSLLLEHGADPRARRGDARSAWTLARRGGFDELAELLQDAGADPEPLSETDRFLAACGRGDAERARKLASPDLLASLAADDLRLLPDAAGEGRFEVALAYVAAGLPVDTPDEQGATALHHAAIRGRADAVRALLSHGADLRIRDAEHQSSPLGWACFGADMVMEPGADYVGCVRALLEAGAELR